MNDIPAQTAVATTGPTRSVLVAASERFGMEPKALEATLRGTVFPSNGTQAEFAAFLVVANEYGLNPMTREIYAYPKKGGGVQPIVSIDGWARIINEHPQFDGMSFEFAELPGKGPHGETDMACTVTIWRKDRAKPTVLTEYLSECWRSTDPWRMKRRMLRHKALIQGARYAFGFASIMDEDEATAITETLTAVEPQKPAKASRRLSAGFAPKGDDVAAGEPQQAVEVQGGPEPEHIDAEFEAVDQQTGEVTDAREPVQTQATADREERLADKGFSGEGLTQDDGMTRAIDPKQVAAAVAAAEAEKKPAPLGSDKLPAVTPAEALEAGAFFHVQSDPVNASGQRPFYDEDGVKRGFAMETHGLRVATDLTGANTTTWAPQVAAEDDAPFDADEGHDTAEQSPWDVFDALLMSSSDWPQIKRAMGELARNPVWNADEPGKASCRAKTWAKAKALGIDPAKDATAFQCFLATSTATADIDAIFADAIREDWYTKMEDAGRNAVTRAVMNRKKALA